MRTQRFDGVRYLVARIEERNARGEASTFWHCGQLHETREGAQKVLETILPNNPDRGKYEVLAVRDGVWGLKDSHFYNWLETGD